MQFSYQINGTHCEACITKINAALSPHFEIIQLTLHPPLLKINANEAPPLDILNKQIAKAGQYNLEPVSIQAQSNKSEPNLIQPDQTSYYPIFLIVAYIIGVAVINNFQENVINWQSLMNQFMAGFFLVFSAFKFLDLRGFADGYATYDLLAKRWHAYGFIYPFLELGLGILYLTQWAPTFTLIATIIIMGFSSLGVINSLLKKQKIQCACLGTVLKVPLSSITLVEDLLMVFLAAVSLII